MNALSLGKRAPFPLVVVLACALAAAGLQAAAPAVRAIAWPASVDPGLRAAVGSAPVIVQRSTADGTVERAFTTLGGTITRDLPIVDGFAGILPSGALDALTRIAGVRAISLDRAVRMMHAGSEPVNAAGPTAVYAPEAWAAGYDGSGVTVAVIDTGVADVPPLSGRIVRVTDPVTGSTANCINFSGESGCADSYGHGTFVAGVVAGNGAGSGGAFKGVAPGARILSVKLAGRNGAADVSTLLAAIQWVVSHRAQYGIRVLNLSVGTDSPQSYLIDPLNYAVERAWHAGIVVVAAASNRGPGPATITKPADDPWVITVGAIDDGGTVDPGDDMLPDFSARGPTLSDSLAKPDLVAPGAHIVSLRAPGSALEDAFPSTIGGWYRRGSGTSFAAPAVAGAVALMLQRDPALTPDQVKYALMASARPTPASSTPFEVGAGMLDAAGAVLDTPQGYANQGLLQSDGSGSIDAARGTLRFATTGLLSTEISGLLTQQLLVFDGLAYRTIGWTGSSWLQSQWYGAKWQGAKWQNTAWHGAKWQGAKWQGAKWQSADGSEPSYGTPWLGSAIYGAWE